MKGVLLCGIRARGIRCRHMKKHLLKAGAWLAALCGPLVFAAPALAAPFTVGTPTPNSTFVNAPTEFSATYTNAGATVHHCNLSHNGVNKGAMTIGGGVAKKTITFAGAGTGTIRVTCYNADESAAAYNERTVTVFSDSNAPAIGSFSLSPSSPVAGSSTNISATYDDTDFGSGMNTCHLIVNSAVVAIMDFSGGVGSTAGTVDADYTFPTGGSFAVEMQCTDRSGNLVNRAQTVSVTAPADTTAPSVNSLTHTPSSPVEGNTITLRTTATDAVGVASCDLWKEGSFYAHMSPASGGWEATYTAAVGTHWFFSRCSDAAGNSGSSSDKYITVEAAPTGGTDTTAPTVSSVSPSTATQNTARTFSVSYSDDGTVASCRLYVGQPGGGYANYAMSVPGGSAGTASYAYTFPGSVSPGNYNVYATCTDGAGNTGTGSTTSVTLSASSSPGTGSPHALKIVKLACPAGAIDVNHPCKAVYYVDASGRRHAFPNEKVYFTWYTNFDAVVQLSASELSALPLGTNVNYRPGVRMVKFTTLNNVYVVGRYGELRWVTSEAVATSLYGTNWNTKIDDINDAFFGDYSFGTAISSAGTYSPSAETAAVASIDANTR